jgi:Uma2 family endonuclease
MQVNIQDDVRVAILPASDSDEAFDTFCRDNPGLRVEQKRTGEIIVLPPAGNESSDRNTDIISQLYVWTIRDGRGRAFDSNTVFRLPDGTKMGPDAAWVSKGKILAFSKTERKKFLPIAPEFIIELRSESDRMPDLEQKMQDWVRNGVELGWLIDADAKTVWIYKGNDVTKLTEPVTVVGTGPVAGFELSMKRIYQGLDL